MSTDSKTVLVVDDAGLVRLYLRTVLEGAGFQVEEALNGLEALEKLLVTPVQLLIVDVNMPHMDGITFLTRLRQKEGPLATIPALVTSNESKPQDIEAALRAGANYYLVKPIDEATLVEISMMLMGVTP